MSLSRKQWIIVIILNPVPWTILPLSYAYFLEKKGIDNSENGNKYQKLAGVDAKDGLVLFNLESINSA